MYQFCERSIQGTKLMHLTRAELSDVRKKLIERFVSAKTIPGKRGFHQFTPTFSALSRCKTSIRGNRLHKEIFYIKPDQFLICFSLHDENFSLGMPSKIDKENEDVLVKILKLENAASD